MKSDHESIKKSSNKGTGKKYDAIINGFQIVRDMFFEIDEDRSGEITLTEFQAALPGVSNSKLCEKRMRELDFDQDQQITYKEFCIGIAVWVGFVDAFDDA